MVIEPLLNVALEEDTRGEGYVSTIARTSESQHAKLRWILSISIYVAAGAKLRVPLGKRVDVYYVATPDLKRILEEEQAGTYIKSVQEETGNPGNMAVLGKIPLSLSAMFTLLTVDSFSKWSNSRFGQKSYALLCRRQIDFVRAGVSTGVSESITKLLFFAVSRMSGRKPS